MGRRGGGTVDAYVAPAIALAGNRAELARLRAHLREHGPASPPFATQRTTWALEAAHEATAGQQRSGVRGSFRIELQGSDP